MARQSKHIRFQVAHKAAQMMAEEGISDYAFAKRKAAKFFGLMMGTLCLRMKKLMMLSKNIKLFFLMKNMRSDLKY